MHCFVGIDLGTSGCRAIAIDESGHLLAQANTVMPPPHRDGAAVEQHPDQWQQALFQTLDELFCAVDPVSVAAIAVDGTSSTLFLADEHGKPLSAALMYNDARATEEAKFINGVAPRESAAHGPTSGLAKLLWMQKQPYASKAAMVLHQADWVVGLLSGGYGHSDQNNCLKLGYDALSNRWPEWLDQLGVNRAWLPEVHQPGTTIATISLTMQARFKLTSNTLVVAGTTDSTAAILATGASQPGEAVTSLGSTLVMKVITDKPVFAPEYGVYSQPFGNHWLVGGGSNSGGAVLLHHFSRDQLAEMTPLLAPDSPTGYDYYPLISPGERFPVSDPAMEPRLSPRPDEDHRFFQAMLEGMSAIELQSYQKLQELGCSYPTSVRSAGGGSRNPAWSIMRERRLGVPLLNAEQQEAAYGSALLARQGWQQGES